MVKKDMQKSGLHLTARRKFLELSLESTRKSYYPQLQKQLERAKENERHLQLLIDNLPAQISYVNSKEEYVLVNKEFEMSLGLKREQIIGRQMNNILGHKNYTRVKSHIEYALSGKSGRIEIPFTTREEEEKFYEINYVPETDSRGKVNGFYILTIDLTEKKRAGEEKLKLKDRLRQAQKMEAIGTLSGGIAHDFNNILSGIFGYSQLVKIHRNEPDKVKKYNRQIFEGAQRASSLIQQILSFSRQSEHNKEPLSLLIILKEALNMIRSVIPSNIEIKEELNSSAKILADPTQIHQVIMNLCTNAYHAMGNDGGILRIVLEEEDIPRGRMSRDIEVPKGKYFRLSISDTGPGIEDHIKEKIFDPYFTTKEIGRGTGLGLAVVDGIVKKHKGFIEVETRRGKGTHFHVYLPVITHGVAGSVTPGNKKQEPTGSERIMIVDDEPAILETLKAILSRRGYHISIYDNGESAFNAFIENPDGFDLIVTDMTMPKMSGDKLALAVLKKRKDMPIIICTGFNEGFSEKDALRVGIKKYIQKPVVGSELSSSIRELLDP